MSEPIRAQLERGLGLGLAAVAAMVGITCGSRGALEHGPIAPLSTVSAGGGLGGRAGAGTGPGTGTGTGTGTVAGGGAGVVARARSGDPRLLDLPKFYADLGELERKGRREAVRVLWLGDSHTAADYLTGALRSRLQARFGAGGPGFVRVGLRPYRHSQVRWACDGAWKIEPVPPPRRTPFDDGVFGLGGLRALPDGAPAQAGFELSKGAAGGQLRWQLWYSLGAAESFKVTVAGVSQVVTSASAARDLPGAGFVSLDLQSGPEDRLELLTLGGSPRFFGLIVEGSEPGLVIDAVGIDGARLATALAWGEASFEAALRARAPSLVAFAFGTNEAFDADKVEKYRAQYQALLARVRVATPDVDCLIVGPPDAIAVAGGSEPRVSEIDSLQRSVAAELGCGYVSQLEIMGGPGSYSKWTHETPKLARGDRLHLTARGYEVMADSIASKLLAAYAVAQRSAPAPASAVAPAPAVAPASAVAPAAR